MTKNKKVELNRSSDLESVDQELDDAMERLTSANEKVDELLASMEPPPAPDAPSRPEGAPEQSAPVENGESESDVVPQEPESEAETASS